MQHGLRGTVSTPSRDVLGGDDERVGRSCRVNRGTMGELGRRCTIHGCSGRLVGSEELKERALVEKLGGGRVSNRRRAGTRVEVDVTCIRVL